MKIKILIYLLLSVPLFTMSQSIVNVNPAQGMQGTQLDVAITGQNTDFSTGTNTAMWFTQGSNLIYSSYIIQVSLTYLKASFNIPMMADTGFYDVHAISYPNTIVSMSDGFRVTTNPAQPKIIDVDPDTGLLGTTLNVQITGQNTHFFQGTQTIVQFQQGSQTIYPISNTVVSDTLINSLLQLPNNAPLGYYDVRAYDPFAGWVEKQDAFNILPSQNQPQLLYIYPNAGMRGTALFLDVGAKSTHFTQGPNTAVFSKGLNNYSANNINVYNDSILTIEIMFPVSAPLGFYDLNLYNYIDDSLYLASCLYLFDSIIGIPEIIAKSGIHIYPNPADNYFYVEWDELIDDEIDLVLFNMDGKKVIEQRISSYDESRVNISGLRPGLYTLVIYTEKKEIRQKIIKK